MGRRSYENDKQNRRPSCQYCRNNPRNNNRDKYTVRRWIYWRHRYHLSRQSKRQCRENARQIEVAKDILGLRTSTNNVGALLELEWSDIETKATQRHLVFWWRLGHTHPELMRRREWQIHQRHMDEYVEERARPFNWSREARSQ